MAERSTQSQDSVGVASRAGMVVKIGMKGKVRGDGCAEDGGNVLAQPSHGTMQHKSGINNPIHPAPLARDPIASEP